MKKNLLIMLAAWLLAVPTSFAAVVYRFDFTNLSGAFADFSIELTYDTYVTTTGPAALPGASLATTLGYPVAFAGTNDDGLWIFDDDGVALLEDGGFSLDNDSFLFTPETDPGGYYTAPGVFTGRVGGNAPSFGSFTGLATLTITERAASAPSPSPLALLALGLVTLGWTRRRSATRGRVSSHL